MHCTSTAVLLLALCLAAVSAKTRPKISESVERWTTVGTEGVDEHAWSSPEPVVVTLHVAPHAPGDIAILPNRQSSLTLELFVDRQLLHPQVQLVAVSTSDATSTKHHRRAIELGAGELRLGSVVGQPTWQVQARIAPLDDNTYTLEATIHIGDGQRLVLEPAGRYSDAELVALVANHHLVLYHAAHLHPNMTQHLQTCGHGMQQKLLAKHPAAQQLRQRRDTPPKIATAKKVQAPSNCGESCNCPIALVCDYECYIHYGSEAEATGTIISMMAVAARIFTFTDFEDVTGIGFSIQTVIVYTDTGASNPVPASDYAADDYLERFSDAGWADYCLSHVFTHRDFADGVLGLAWVGTTRGGGICDPNNYNTGFTSSINYGSSVSLAVQQITLAHELGHNFGSPHDTETETCSPGGLDGNYVMYPYATDGSKPNNDLFSPCSIDSISPVLSAKREGCFLKSVDACGNGIVEGDEICDCGTDCANQPCCTTNCTLPVGVQCSPQDPVKFPCCAQDCTFAASDSLTCFAETDCTEAATCSGDSPKCPSPSPKRPSSNTTVIPCSCGDTDCTAVPQLSSAVCDAGVCNRSWCDVYSAVECVLQGQRSCELACQGPGWGNGSECVSSVLREGEPSPPDDVPPLYLAAGQTCNNYEGYCSQGGQCVTVGSKDLIDKLDEIFKNFSFSDSWKWIKNNWPYILIGVGVIALICILLRVTYPRKRRRKGYSSLEDGSDAMPLIETGKTQTHLSETRRATVGGGGGRRLAYHHQQMSQDMAKRLVRRAGVDGAFLIWDYPASHRSDHKHCITLFCQGVVHEYPILLDGRSSRLYVQFDVHRKFRDLESMVARFRAGGGDVLACALTKPIAYGVINKGARPLIV